MVRKVREVVNVWEQREITEKVNQNQDVYFTVSSKNENLLRIIQRSIIKYMPYSCIKKYGKCEV